MGRGVGEPGTGAIRQSFCGIHWTRDLPTDRKRLARFQRETDALALLNHGFSSVVSSGFDALQMASEPPSRDPRWNCSHEKTFESRRLKLPTTDATADAKVTAVRRSVSRRRKQGLALSEPKASSLERMMRLSVG
jgi:hypothetical protein